MKKTFIALTIALSVGNAHALNVGNYIGVGNGYSAGYSQGKRDAYNNVAKTFIVVGVIAITGVILYRASEERRWGVNENGLVYKF